MFRNRFRTTKSGIMNLHAPIIQVIRDMLRLVIKEIITNPMRSVKVPL